MQESDSLYDDRPASSNNRTSTTYRRPTTAAAVVSSSSDRDDNETADEDYPLKFTSSYSLDSAYPSALQELRLRDVSSNSINDQDQDHLEHGPQFLPNRSVYEILIDFCDRTSSHGIPHIGSSRSLFGKLFWTVIFLACSVAFILHTYYTIIVYLEYSVILRMQLKFNAAPFPAVTVCNLNPYKASLIQNMSFSEERIFGLSDKTDSSKRLKRQVYYEIVYAKCRCLNLRDEECVPIADRSEPVFTTCLCYFDVKSGNIWPCYDAVAWTSHRCTDCSTNNACPFPPRAADTENGELDESCMCQNISRFCVKRHFGPIRYWDGYYYGIRNVTTESPSTLATSPKPEIDEEDTSVEYQEVLTYSVATMNRSERIKLSYGLDEFLILCSFNGARCNKERDFRLHDTPRHGNCYTYNFNSSVHLINSRAGPLYGLRLLLHVDQSDYLNYIEGAGVRVVVHHQNQYPFPDTFGYSAPTGAISSFGLKYKQFQRKGFPWSKCTFSEKFDKKDYLFDEEYSSEGCYRSCVQKVVVKNCTCGSHRFPKFKNSSICNYLDPKYKKCMNNIEEAINKNNNCSCLQPCHEPVYQTSYSASSWPAENFKSVKEEHCKMADRINQSCIDYNKKHTTFIEVFYEQLNYEMLSEVEAYTIVNLFADFGGNIGLWIGFSTITVVEFLELALELLYHFYYKSTKPIRKLSRTKFALGMQYINRVAEQSYPAPGKQYIVESSLSSPLGNKSSTIRR